MKGMSVVINEMFGTRMVDDPCIGKVITNITLEQNVLVIHFRDEVLRFRDDGQSCCETRYLHTDDWLGYFLGVAYLGAELLDAPAGESEYDYHEIQFLTIRTELGTFTVEAHNIHNGYYGGFSITAEFSPQEGGGA